MDYKYLKDIFNKILKEYCNSNNNLVVKEALEYCLFGGKFLRGCIVLAIYFSKEKYSNIKDIPINIKNLSLSVELIHNASLIIDDLPSMDNDDYRRNKPSLHKKYCVKFAKLISNNLILDSYQMIVSNNSSLLNKIFINNCVNACVGQTIDLNTNSFRNKEIYFKLNYKTSALFIISFVNGYFSITDKDKIDKRIINKYILLGMYFSNMFQIIDDFEDLEQDKLNNNLINHVLFYGKKNAYIQYTINRVLFIQLLKKLDLFNDYFQEILDILKRKIDLLINDMF